MNPIYKGAGAIAGVLLASWAVRSYHTTSSKQIGFDGVAMQVTESNVALAAKAEANEIPPALPPASPGGKLAVDAYKNVQVLGHLSSGDFTRLMTAISTWIAPTQGCAYCHAPQRDAQGKIVTNEDGLPQADLNNMHSDELYTKRVARRMLQMTMRINGEWKAHVRGTGVTCWTCHRGNPVPQNIWFDQPEQQVEMIGYKAQQNQPSATAGLTSLPNTALRTFLVEDENIRVQTPQALPAGNHHSIKETEWTYALMIHFSKSLGVNCTYCHNSREWSDWSQSPPARQTAWFGIRMVRDLNAHYLIPLDPEWPANRRGPTGDGPKLACATCHQGAYKPLLGVSMLADYPALAEAKPQPSKTVVDAPPSDAGVTSFIEGGAAVTATDGGAASGLDGGVAKASLDAAVVRALDAAVDGTKP